MMFKYVGYSKLVESTLEFAKIQSERETRNSAGRKRVFTDEPRDTQIQFVPSYLLQDGESPNSENIVYSVDKTMLMVLTLSPKREQK